jgi:hypothetical protein
VASDSKQSSCGHHHAMCFVCSSSPVTPPSWMCPPRNFRARHCMNKRARASVALQRQEVGRLKEAGGEPFQHALGKLLSLEQELRDAQRERSATVVKENAALAVDPNYPPPREIPVDEGGFTAAFPVEEASTAASSFFEEWGFVVFENVLGEDECEATVSEIWDELEKSNSDLDRENIATYDALHLVHGLAPLTPQYTPQVVRNRQNPRLVAAFAGLLGCGTQDLLVSQDRWCLYRPTIPEDQGAGQEGDARDGGELARKMARWRTDTRLHLDMHPWTYQFGGTVAETLR